MTSTSMNQAAVRRPLVAHVPSPEDAFERACERAMSLRRLLEAQSERPVRLIETHISWVALILITCLQAEEPIDCPSRLHGTGRAARCM